MKKIISVLLAAAMLFSFTACGKAQSFLGKNISVSVKKSGTKNMTISCKDTYEEDVTLTYTFSGGADKNAESEDTASDIYSVALSKDEAHAHEYKMSGVSAGTGSILIIYSNAEEKVLGTVLARVQVDGKLKVYCVDVTISNGNDYLKLQQQNEDDPVIEITDGDSGIKYVKFSNRDGFWRYEEDYDSGVVTVEGPNWDEDLTFDVFGIGAVGEGECAVYFVCEKALLQVMMRFKAEKNPEDEGAYILTLVDYATGPWEKKTSRDDKEELEDAKEEIEEIIDLPDEVVIEEIDFYSADGTNNGDTADMTFVYKGITMDYICSKSLKYKDLYDSVMETDPIETLVMSGGGIVCEYNYFEIGYGAALWRENDVATRLTFVEGQDKTSEDFKEVLQIILDAQIL